MERKRIYTKKLAAAIAETAHLVTAGKYHVISGTSSKWSVVSEGRTRALKVFPTKDQAINYAKETAFKKTGEVIVHSNTGQISEKISFAKE